MSVIQPIIVVPERQRAAAQRLVEHCRLLDGTEVKLFVISTEEDAKMKAACPKSNFFPSLQVKALHYGARMMEGKPFIWLEWDSVPLVKGWAGILTDEYILSGKVFMLSPDNELPGDLAGGIGVYGPQTAFLVPKSFSRHGWDYFIVTHLKELTHFSTRIQHSYGIYDGGMNVKAVHRFPNGERPHWFRKEAVIFHRDKHQDLLDPRVRQCDKPRFFHSGDLGDIIAALPTIRGAGGGHLIIGNSDRLRCRERMSVERFEFIKPLLEQGAHYLSSVSYEDQGHADYDFSTFRDTPTLNGESLAEWQARAVTGAVVDLSPWLHVLPDARSLGKTVIARSARYHNPAFPWRRVTAGRPLLHVGTLREHKELQKHLERNIPHVSTPTAHDMAGIIAGSELFIGNQSLPCWLAMAMGHPLIQETWHREPNSKIIRDNAQFVSNQTPTINTPVIPAVKRPKTNIINKPGTIAIALQCWPGDYEQARKLIQVMVGNEPTPRTDVELYIATTREVGDEKEKELLRLAVERFPNCDILTSTRSGKGHPQGCNDLWQATMEEIAARRKAGICNAEAIYTFEPDCVIMRDDWINVIKLEASLMLAQRKEVAGFCTRYHVNGNLIARTDLFTRHLHLNKPSAREAWDVKNGRFLLSIALKSNHLLHQEGPVEHFTIADWQDRASRGIAIWHGIKSDDRHLVATLGLAIEPTLPGDPVQIYYGGDSRPIGAELI